jgi:DNA transformation protein
MGQLLELINIGTRTEKHLNEIGVHTPEDLKKMGSVEAWRRIRAQYPTKDCCLCALYALEGALLDIPWNKLPEELKDDLKKRAGR